MKSGPTHGVSMDRREILGAAALSAVATVGAGALPPAGPDFGPVERVPLWPGTPPGGPVPALQLHVVERSPDPAKYHLRALSGIARPFLAVVPSPSPRGAALLIIPGGGYRELTIDIAFAAARRFAQAGVTGFVLFYRLPHEGWRNGPNVPLQDAMRAMRLLRAGAAHYGVDPARLGALGFSAGGHLAAMLSLRSGAEVYVPVDGADRESARPLFGALLYPVITMLPPYAHEASREMLLGENPTVAERAAYSCERLVTHGTPPMFLAAAADDPDVPVDNTLAMFAALRRVHVPAEMHVFERGGHGFGLGNPGQPLSAWPALLLAWLRAHQLL
ncbi:MAG TPA: alpha/beta hydrolase [Rhizomicrobium sp.]|nr:alpha/beta hydrolase [Rhizomicrobium sp.]